MNLIRRRLGAPRETLRSNASPVPRPGDARRSNPRRFARSVVLGALTAAFALPSIGVAFVPSLVPVGDQLQLNVFELGYQGAPRIVRDAGDGFVVLYRSGTSLFARRVTRAGMPTGSEQLVATGLTATDRPAAVSLADGSTIAVFTSQVESGGAGTGISARRLSANGAPLALPFPVNSHTPGDQWEPSVAALGTGFVVAWRSDSSPGNDQNGDSIVARRFDGAAAPLGADFQLNTVTAGNQFEPALAAIGGGDFVACWTTAASGGPDVAFRRFAGDGTPRAAQAPLATFIDGGQATPAVVATPDGGFLAVWRSFPPALGESSAENLGEPIGDGIQARKFSVDGVAWSQEITVEIGDPHPTIFPERNPSLAAGPRGTVLLVADAGGVPYARLLDSRDARPLESPNFLPNTTMDELDYVVAAFGTGDDVLVAWESPDSAGSDIQDRSVQIRLMTAGAVAAWEFDEDAGALALDSLGEVFDDAQLAGGATRTVGRLSSGALELDGDGWAALASSVDLDLTGFVEEFPGTHGVTIAAWILLDQLPSQMTEPFQGIFDSAQDNYVLYLDRDAAELRFKVTDSDGTAERPGIPESQLAVGRWLHVVGSYRPAASAAAIYLDGQIVDTHLAAGLDDPVRTTPTQVPAIGRDGVIDQYRFRGAIDQIAVYRRGLTAEEVELLRGDWLFDDGFETGSTSRWSLSAP